MRSPRNRAAVQSGDGRIRVMLDATAMPVDRGGVARYVDELVHMLDVDLVVVCQPRDAERYRSLAATATVVSGPRALRWRAFRLAWEQLALPRLATRYRVDVIHSPHYTTPITTALPRVVTVHDVTFFTEPTMHRPIKRWFFKSWIRSSVHLAQAIIAPSRATATELEHATGHPADRVVVAHHGVDHERFRPPTDESVDAVLTRRGVTRPYVLFLGTIEPRKNVPTLIRAHARLAVELEQPPLLVLAGARGWETGLDAALSEHPAPDLVLSLGYVDAVDIVPLLGGATVVAYPSEGEGFGLPVLEAMAVGAVVLTTRRLALPEVAGDGAVYCEPDVSDIAQSLRELVNNPTERDQIRARARARAAQFSWRESANVHRAAYQAAADARRAEPRPQPLDPEARNAEPPQ